MSTPVTYLGVTYNIPSFGDGGYAQGAGNLSLYLIALSNGSLTTSGGVFTLTNDANFGTSFGLIAPYYKSASANIATSGVLRLSNTDTVQWRNFANVGNNLLGVNTSDQLTYNGTPIGLAGGSVTSVSGTANQIDSTGGNTPVLSLSSTLVFPGTATGTLTGHSTLDLPLTGGTMSGALDMGSNQIHNVATGTSPTDAANVGQTVSNPLTTNLAAGGNKITGLTQGTTTGDAIAFPITTSQISASAGITGTQLANATITGTQIASSVALAGSPTTTTQSTGDNSTKIATTAYTDTAVQIVHLGAASASSSTTIDFTGLNGAIYDHYEIFIDALVPGTDAVSFRMQFSTGSGFLTTNYSYENLVWAGTTSSVTSATGATSFDVMDGAGTGSGVTQSLKITVFGADSTLARKRSTWESTGFYQSGLFFTTKGGGIVLTNSSVIDGLRFSMSTGTIAQGQFTVYGYKA